MQCVVQIDACEDGKHVGLDDRNHHLKQRDGDQEGQRQQRQFMEQKKAEDVTILCSGLSGQTMRWLDRATIGS